MKTCSKCFEDKPISDYPKNKGFKDGINSFCKSCNSNRHKTYYQEVVKDRRSEIRAVIDQIKLDRGCIDCGYSEYACALDFDHGDGENKIFTISNAIVRNYSLEKLLDEIEKCDVVCANCHRVRTARRGGWLDGE